MKKLSFINKLVFVLNSLFAVLLLVGYLLPYIAPSVFPALSVVSLFLPILILVNICFVIYWLLGLKRQFLLSGGILLVGLYHISGLYRFGNQKEDTSSMFSVVSYNVKTFSNSGSDKARETETKVAQFFIRENPDIISIQEYNGSLKALDRKYPYQFKKMKPFKAHFGQVLFSKHPIINTGSFDFKNTGNNIIYADIVMARDTVRVYNVHLQSLRLSSQFKKLQQEDSKKLVGRMGAAFKRQEDQVLAFLENEKKCPYPVIVTGDFNNSATSYIYRKMKGEKEDAFAKAGTGTGRTFTFDFVPLRIDFILNDPQLNAVDFKNYDIPWSDHQPVLASFRPKE